MVILSEAKYLDFYYETDYSLPTSDREIDQSDSNRIIQKSLLPIKFFNML